MHIIYLRKYFAGLPTEWFIPFMHSYYVKFAAPCLGGETVKHVSNWLKRMYLLVSGKSEYVYITIDTT